MHKLIRNNQVIALVDEPRYVKQKASSGAWIKCPRGEADGIAVGGQVYGLGEVYPVAVDNGEYLLELGGKVEEASEVNKIVFVTLAENETLDETTALEHKQYFDEWSFPVNYAVGNIRRHGEKLYKCLQSHTSQENWTPDTSASLWVEIAAPGEYREIKENMLSTEAFALGEIGWWQTKDNLFRSLIDANIYTPESYPAGWEAVA